MKYTLRQLEVFLATAHHENISRAAADLAMSQSAASSALKELEQQFDIQLFERAGKKLILNDFGRLIRPQAEALLSQANNLEQTLTQHEEVGSLKVGATLTIGNYLCVGIMARYMELYQHAKVAMSVANTETILQQVAHFEIDVGLIEGESWHPDMDIIPWRDDELIAFCAPQHPLAKKKKLSDTDLLETTWIVRETGSGTRQTFGYAMHGILSELNILLELQHTEAIKRAVEAGLGIGCLSKISLQEAFKRGSLVPLTIPHRHFKRHFYFVLHKQKYISSSIEKWLQLCRAWPS